MPCDRVLFVAPLNYLEWRSQNSVFAGATIGTRFMAGLFFGITATDPPTFFGAAAALLLVALAATCIPALRASRATPLATVRGE